MKKTLVSTIILMSLLGKAKCQSSDTVSIKIIEIKSLDNCYLIKGVSSCKISDTIVVVSEKKKSIPKGIQKIELGKTYRFIVENDLVIGSPTKKFSMKFENTTVWTRGESKKIKPKYCLNCIGEYVNQQ